MAKEEKSPKEAPEVAVAAPSVVPIKVPAAAEDRGAPSSSFKGAAKGTLNSGTKITAGSTKQAASSNSQSQDAQITG